MIMCVKITSSGAAAALIVEAVRVQWNLEELMSDWRRSSSGSSPGYKPR